LIPIYEVINVSNHQESIEKRARDTLERELQNMDASSLSRLRQARERALSNEPHRSGWVGWVATATAIAILILPIIWHNRSVLDIPLEDNGFVQAFTQADMELMLAAEEIDFYEELEFLLWLDQQGEAG
jgi:hypothetical protein